MKEELSISVALATYNGENFLREQLLSIVSQLGEDDELIISDDNSSDGTMYIIKEFSCKDERIHLTINLPQQKGVVRNFENAIINCKKSIILLSDQDDIWLPQKISTIRKYFDDPSRLLIVHDLRIVNQELKEIEPSFYRTRNSKKGVWKNFYKNSYIGAGMAFRKELLKVAIPFPKNLYMHDQWLGILADIHGKTEFVPETLGLYRIHDENTVGIGLKNSFFQKLNNRLRLMINLFKRIVV